MAWTMTQPTRLRLTPALAALVACLTLGAPRAGLADGGVVPGDRPGEPSTGAVRCRDLTSGHTARAFGVTRCLGRLLRAVCASGGRVDVECLFFGRGAAARIALAFDRPGHPMVRVLRGADAADAGRRVHAVASAIQSAAEVGGPPLRPPVRCRAQPVEGRPYAIAAWGPTPVACLADVTVLGCATGSASDVAACIAQSPLHAPSVEPAELAMPSPEAVQAAALERARALADLFRGR